MKINNNVETNNTWAPYTNKMLVEKAQFPVINPADPHTKDAYSIKLVPSTEFVKQPGYEAYRDKLNALYRNYSRDGYLKLKEDIDAYNETRKERYLIEKADSYVAYQIKKYAYHFYGKSGKPAAWIEKLDDKQRDLLLARARALYALEPERIELQTKAMYPNVPERIVKDHDERLGDVYYTQAELAEAGITELPRHTVVGRFKFISETVKRMAEDQVLEAARWMATMEKQLDDPYELHVHYESEDGMKPVLSIDHEYDESREVFYDFLEPVHEAE